jgi:NADPH:quinone reductase-like Zn-dependent oxidoreductase
MAKNTSIALGDHFVWARTGGKIVLVGLLTGADSNTASIFMTAFYRDVTICAVRVGSRASFEEMNRAIEHSKLRPVIDRRFPFSQAVDGYHHFKAGRTSGRSRSSTNRKPGWSARPGGAGQPRRRR